MTLFQKLQLILCENRNSISTSERPMFSYHAFTRPSLDPEKKQLQKRTKEERKKEKSPI
jgi:hypothetical protein